MPECSNDHRLIESWIADELDRESSVLLDRHLEECRDCRDIAELHRRLSAARLDTAAPSRHDLTTVRWSVLGQLRRERRAPRRFPNLVAFAAAAVLLLAVGIAIGRETVSGSASALSSDIDSLVGRPEQLAESPYWLSNIEISAETAGERNVSFDISRRVEITRASSDPFVREVAVEALNTSTTIGERLATVRAVDGLEDSRVQASLIDAVVNDPSVAVRLTALGSLRPGLAIEAALLEVLRDDPSVEMRMRAIDLLGSVETTKDDVRQALGQTDSRGGLAVVRHAYKTLEL